MDRLELFAMALERSREHVRLWGDHAAIRSILTQLEYLRAVEQRDIEDRTLLAEITVGVLAMRDIEDRDLPLAELLHAVSAEARAMAKGL